MTSHDSSDTAWSEVTICGDQASCRREIGADRIMARVDYDRPWDDEEHPVDYRWSVQDGSCGKVLDSGWTDGHLGLAKAQLTADAAAAALFPDLSRPQRCQPAGQ